ncbi:cytochrome P450 [Conidiobolus coronatus NRRL 28638]|uniref:Cytochrome P450 n=1 Tax=Conidiobolus coronatus (strain ATCC 28846 / CBS 209.66 / NRRL 28638) TaxID=796925 RepID=A0A137P3H6_CONC2|nr:cytochrome P450 [Conidiobolus coronatus NRRL 28638]|eukprot:KXN69573.1 cytochrome P450 [Conidiobolus coronatus NRRL 28638]
MVRYGANNIKLSPSYLNKKEKLVDNLIGKYSRKISGKVDLNDLATRFSFEVISNILLDNSCEEMYDDFVSLANSATIVKLLVPTPFSTPEIGRIHERIISMKSTFYTELLELFDNKPKLAAKAVSFIMLAGFETASTGIICAVHRLAFDQDLQEKVRTDQTLIPKLVSLSLFANPPLMQNFNMLTTSNIEIGDGIVLPKNTRVNIFINAVHNYPDFSMDNNADSFCTFSGGQRRCVGEGLARIEIRAFIKLMLNFRFKTDDRLVPNSESAITAKPERIFIGVF